MSITPDFNVETGREILLRMSANTTAFAAGWFIRVDPSIKCTTEHYIFYKLNCHLTSFLEPSSLKEWEWINLTAAAAAYCWNTLETPSLTQTFCGKSVSSSKKEFRNTSWVIITSNPSFFKDKSPSFVFSQSEKHIVIHINNILQT